MTDKLKLGHGSFFLAITLAAVLLADWLTGELAVAEYFSASKIGGFHFAAQFFSEVRRDWMTVVQAVCGHCELSFGIEDDEIGIVICCEAAFAFVAAC